MKKSRMVTDIPYLMKLWDFEKNTLDPSKIKPKSEERVWWKCPDCGMINNDYVMTCSCGCSQRSAKRLQKKK